MRKIPSKKELYDFMDVCKEFIEAQRKMEKEDGLCEKGDLAILYRFINETNAWEQIADWKRRKLI
jgi:hypothetical protein